MFTIEENTFLKFCCLKNSFDYIRREPRIIVNQFDVDRDKITSIRLFFYRIIKLFVLKKYEILLTMNCVLNLLPLIQLLIALVQFLCIIFSNYNVLEYIKNRNL